MNLSIKNNGQDILETEYWDTELARRGYFYLSWNAGAARLLLPDALREELTDMRGAREVIVSRGPLGGRDAYEMLFEDGSDSPYSVHLGMEQTDRLLPSKEHGRSFTFTAWTRNGEQLRLPDQIPHRGSPALP